VAGDDVRGQGPDVTITDSAPNGIAVDRTDAFTAMVVDDHPLLRESMVARLKAMGATEVLEAASVAEARARANVSGPRDLWHAITEMVSLTFDRRTSSQRLPGTEAGK